MSASDYTGLITAEHADKSNFVSVVSALVGPLVDIQAQTLSMPSLYDIDSAVGSQLDVVGQWVGQGRFLTTPLTGVYFAFDTSGVGFDQGAWQGPYDPTTGLVALSDDAYRTLLRATIAANHWDGTISGAYSIWSAVFSATGISMIMQDYENMTMLIGVLSSSGIDAVTQAMIKNGLLDLRPAGVEMISRVIPSVTNTPFFGFDAQNTSVSGFDTGSFATPL